MSEPEEIDRIACWFCGAEQAIGLALGVGGEHHGDAMPACSENEGAGFALLSDEDRAQMFGPFEARGASA